MKYQIVSDSSMDLSEELAKENNIEVVPFYVSFDSETYQKEIEEIAVRDFYQKMVDEKGVFPKTSCPSAQDFYNVFEKHAKENVSIICICISTKFSSSMQSALNAKDMIAEDYPDAEITVIDSQINTVLQGMYVLEACRLRDEGVEYKEAVERLLAIRESGRIFFTIGSMDYLKHGGRIGKLAGIAASLLNVKPLITLKEGEIFSSGIVRNRKKSLQKVIELLIAYIEERKIDMDTYRLCIGYGYSYEEAEEFKSMALEKLEKYGVKDIKLYQIGATIGVHTGPYPIGFGIIKKA